MIANKDCGVFSFAIGRKQDHDKQNMRLKGASL
jgi:hypothetical protein